MAKKEHDYRGIYDSGEVGRIEKVLAEQRSMFNESDSQSFSQKDNLIKYAVIGLGVTIMLITLKFVKK